MIESFISFSRALQYDAFQQYLTNRSIDAYNKQCLITAPKKVYEISSCEFSQVTEVIDNLMVEFTCILTYLIIS